MLRDRPVFSMACGKRMILFVCMAITYRVMPVFEVGNVHNTGVEKSKFQTLVYS